MSVEELLVNLIDLAKVIDVGNENIDLNNALPGGACSSDDGLDVGQNLASLNLNVLMALDELALRSQRNLARKVNESIGLDGLGVRADRSGSIFSEDLPNG